MIDDRFLTRIAAGAAPCGGVPGKFFRQLCGLEGRPRDLTADGPPFACCTIDWLATFKLAQIAELRPQKTMGGEKMMVNARGFHNRKFSGEMPLSGKRPGGIRCEFI